MGSVTSLKNQLALQPLQNEIKAHPVGALAISAAAGLVVGLAAGYRRDRRASMDRRGDGTEVWGNQWNALKKLAMMGGYEWLRRTVVKEFPHLAEYAMQLVGGGISAKESRPNAGVADGIGARDNSGESSRANRSEGSTKGAYKDAYDEAPK